MSLDMAVYENEQYVGNGIRESGLKREDIFVTTKYDGGDISSALSTSLRKVSSKYTHFRYLAALLMVVMKQSRRLPLVCSSD